jgi:ActR/RegA family two-component response regulator
MIDKPRIEDCPAVNEIAARLERSGLTKCHLADLEWAAILNALKACEGNRTYAARMLGISTRKIQRWMKRRGFE